MKSASRVSYCKLSVGGGAGIRFIWYIVYVKLFFLYKTYYRITSVLYMSFVHIAHTTIVYIVIMYVDNVMIDFIRHTEGSDMKTAVIRCE